MGAMDLLKKTQKDFVSNQNLGVSESIDYTHKKSTLVEPTFAFVDTLKTNNDSENQVKQNEIIFSSVFLVEIPEVDDKISYDTKIYEVYENPKKMNDLWTIKARENARHSGRAKRRTV